MHSCIVVPASASAVGSAVVTAVAGAAAGAAADHCPSRHGFPFVVVTV